MRVRRQPLNARDKRSAVISLHFADSVPADVCPNRQCYLEPLRRAAARSFSDFIGLLHLLARPMNPTLIGSGVGTDPRHDPFCSASRRGIFAENAYAFSFSPSETTLL